MTINTQALLKDLDEYIAAELEHAQSLEHQADSHGQNGNYVTSAAYSLLAAGIEHSMRKLEQIILEYIKTKQ